MMYGMCRWWVCVLAVAACPLQADPRWIRLRSDHFEMISSGGAGSSRDVLRNFEQIRGLFEDVLKFTPKPGRMVRIVAITNAKEFEHYRPTEGAAAYFVPRPMADYIVLSDLGDAAFRIAVHEYFHLIVHQSEWKLPLWLNEGLAELYSTVRPLADHMLVGVPPPGRREAALANKWTPLDVLMTAGHESSHYREKKLMPSFYGESWGLAHMLVLSEDYRPGFVAFLQQIAAGATGPQALQNAYRKTTQDVDKDLQGYFRRADFRGQLYKLKLLKNPEVSAPAAADDYDVRVELANLLGPGRMAETRKELEALVAARPERVEARVSLAYLDLTQRRQDEALEHLEAAFKNGMRTPKFLFDLGRLATGPDPALAIEAYHALLKLEPEWTEARLDLARLYLHRSDHEAALAVVARIKKVQPEEAPRLFQVMAHGLMGRGDCAEATKAAERWQASAKSDADRSGASRIIDYCTAPKPVVKALPRREDPEGPPLIRYREETPAPPLRELPPPPPQRPSEEGTFVELRCGANDASLVLRLSTGATKVYLIDKPNEVVLQNTGKATMEMTCGRQTARKVTIEFEPAPAGAKADGLLRLLRYD